MTTRTRLTEADRVTVSLTAEDYAVAAAMAQGRYHNNRKHGRRERAYVQEVGFASAPDMRGALGEIAVSNLTGAVHVPDSREHGRDAYDLLTRGGQTVEVKSGRLPTYRCLVSEHGGLHADLIVYVAVPDLRMPVLARVVGWLPVPEFRAIGRVIEISMPSGMVTYPFGVEWYELWSMASFPSGAET